MMKLGMPTMVEMRSIEEGAALCRELGLEFLELNINFSICKAVFIIIIL